MSTELERRLADALHGAVPDPPDGIDPARVLGRARRRHRAMTVGAPLAAAAVVAVVALGVSLLVRDQPSHHAPAAVVASPSPDSLVLRDGDRVQASGMVVAIPGHPVRFCDPDVPKTLPGRAVLPGRAAPPVPIEDCTFGVDVTGVDLAALSDRVEVRGAIQGNTTLTGVFRSGALTVTRQSPYLRPPARPFGIALACQPPHGGWPRGPADENVDLSAASTYADHHPGSVAQLAEARPSDMQVVVYVLTYGDPAPVRAALSGAYPNRLCVVHSRYTAAEVAKAGRLFSIGPSAGSSPLVAAGHGFASSANAIGASGQFEVQLSLPYVTAGLAALADQQPVGLVVFDAWLKPRH